MTSSTRSFAYSYRLVNKCFVKICETSKCHNFLIFQPIFIRFSLFCSENFTLSSEIMLNLFRSSPLRLHLAKISVLWCTRVMPKAWLLDIVGAFIRKWHSLEQQTGSSSSSSQTKPRSPTLYCIQVRVEILELTSSSLHRLLRLPRWLSLI